MPSTKDIQRRIKSINNIKKITRAMEMVAAAKMRKAIEAVLKTRTYAHLSWETILRLANNNNTTHPLLEKSNGKKKSNSKEKSTKVGVIMITSNRGLCGGFNTNLINKLVKSIKKNPDFDHEFILLGKKGRIIYKHNYQVIAEFPKEDLINSSEEVSAVSKLIIEDYLAGKYSKIMLAYTDFINPSKQIPRIKQLLPVDIKAEDERLGTVNKSSHQTEEEPTNLMEENDYLFEPSPEEVLNKLVPQLIKVQLLQAMLESNASEHSARMSTMHQATEAAGDIVAELTLSFNKARQASITAEIAEISAGANALAE